MSASLPTRQADKRLIVANWKMNPSTLGEAKGLFLAVRKESARRARVETVIAPPVPYLAELRKLMTGAHTRLGAQDVSGEQGGTHTGEVSPTMLASVGVSHVIVGHSERRALGEDDARIARKTVAAVTGGLTVILCVGESARDHGGAHLNVVEAQLRAVCADVPRTALGRFVVAYEPLWAISAGDGKGKTATPEDVHEMTIFIRKVLASIYPRQSAERVRILYGGSVNEENAALVVRDGKTDGFLVGGASLKPHTFATILTAANEPRK